MARQRPTRRQVEVLRAYIRAGSVAAAAYELGISETTVRQHLSGLYRRTGCVNAAQAAYWLGMGRINPVTSHSSAEPLTTTNPMSAISAGTFTRARP
jgi:DNA-binding CsgD family transcriptional regulator